jgi:hypothetical protein
MTDEQYEKILKEIKTTKHWCIVNYVIVLICYMFLMMALGSR